MVVSVSQTSREPSAQPAMSKGWRWVNPRDRFGVGSVGIDASCVPWDVRCSNTLPASLQEQNDQREFLCILVMCGVSTDSF